MEFDLARHRFLERLLESADRGRARLAEAYQQNGLTSSQFSLLEAIASHQPDGCAQTELAAVLKLAESTLSVQVEKLHVAGWLHRLRSKQDRRRSVLVLSTEGRQRLTDAQAAVENTLSDWLSGCSREHLEEFTRLLDQLVSVHRQYLCWSSAAAPASLQRDEWGSQEADPRLREAG
ncbi:MAG: MarR family winged helix-turn-helix transcriptional regulator [Planctomycetaceae bacterium]